MAQEQMSTARRDTENDLTCRRALPELHHLPQTHAGGREARVVLDGIHQLVGLPPRHRGGGGGTWGV